MVSVQVLKEHAMYAIRRGLGQRKACTLVGISRSSLFYEPILFQKDKPVVDLMKRLSAKFPRFGYRRIKILLGREGLPMSFSRCARLWRQSELQVPKKKRRRIHRDAVRPMKATHPNMVWSYDFVHDACANGQKIKCLTVIDEFTKECLAIEVDRAIRSERVVAVLERLMSIHGIPKHLRSDNGPEFVSKALLKWVNEESLELLLNEPGKPWQNGTNESFNGKFRDECLSAEWFRNRVEAKVVIEDWRRHYNHERPHSSLDYETPNEFKIKLGINLIKGAEISRCSWY